MIERFKNELAEKIRQKQIGLAVLFDADGRILWHVGRSISGSNLEEGRGFSKSLVKQALLEKQPLQKQEEVITLYDPRFPQSASFFYVKSLLILPIEPCFLLYADSGKDSFSNDEIEFFRTHASALKEIVERIERVQSGNGGIAGTSRAMETVRRQVLQYSVEEEPVLLLGETGVGKSHIAQLIHFFSGRPGQLIIFDTPAIPETIFESELFGHIKGAFTSADRDKKGLVETANEGTLFFDEIAEVPLAVQAKLLRFIETRKYRPLGETREKSSNVRIIAATNRNLEEEIAANRFRRDLFFRLNVLPISIPPLKDRREDIRAVVEEYHHCLRGKTLVPGFWDALFHHPWPGNIRELINILKRAGIGHTGDRLGSEISDYITGFSSQAATPPEAGNAFLAEIKEKIASGQTFWETAWDAFLERFINRDQLRTLLEDFFQGSRNLKDMAHTLHISDSEYPRFISALHKYGIHPDKRR